MTDPPPQTSTLAGAVRIVRMHGFARQVPLILAMMVTGFLEGVGVAALFPILAIVTEGQTGSTALNETIEQALAFFHLPADLEVLCLLIAATIWLKAVISMIVARALGRTGATIGQDIRRRLLQALVNAKWSYFTIQRGGRLVAAATAGADGGSPAFRIALWVFDQAMGPAFFCGLALFGGWKMALVAMGVGVLVGPSLRTLPRGG